MATQVVEAVGTERTQGTNSVLRALVDCRDRQIMKARIQFGLRMGALERGADDSGLDVAEVHESRQYQLLKSWYTLFETCETGLSKSVAKELWNDPDLLDRLREIPGLGAIVDIVLEGGLDGQITSEAKRYELYEYLVAIKGIGPGLAAKLMALIDIHRPQTVSQLWRHAGYGMAEYWVDEKGKVQAPKVGKQFEKQKVKDADGQVVKGPDGKDKEEKVIVVVTPTPEEDWHLETVRDRHLSGWISPYSNRLKTCLFLVARGLMRKDNNPYRVVYDTAREKYDTQRPGWSKGHCNDAARRKLIKVFLSHLWETWRKLEGLPTRRLYVHEKLGHTMVYLPEDFGWPVL